MTDEKTPYYDIFLQQKSEGKIVGLHERRISDRYVKQLCSTAGIR
jgi:hypothetical protein